MSLRLDLSVVCLPPVRDWSYRHMSGWCFSDFPLKKVPQKQSKGMFATGTPDKGWDTVRELHQARNFMDVV